MINKSSLDSIDITSEEGQLLMSALAVLSSIEPKHIESGKFGPSAHVDDILEYLSDLSNRMYHTSEYKSYLREYKIDSIVK